MPSDVVRQSSNLALLSELLRDSVNVVNMEGYLVVRSRDKVTYIPDNDSLWCPSHSCLEIDSSADMIEKEC